MDSFRKYPIVYIPVADPRNPESIKRKFEKDMLYDNLAARDFIKQM